MPSKRSTALLEDRVSGLDSDFYEQLGDEAIVDDALAAALDAFSPVDISIKGDD